VLLSSLQQIENPANKTNRTRQKVSEKNNPKTVLLPEDAATLSMIGFQAETHQEQQFSKQ
jgi:hypothetical protein